MKSEILSGIVDHTAKYFYPPFLSTIIAFILLLFSGFSFFFLAIFAFVWFVDYLFYRMLLSLESYRLLVSENGFEFEILEEDSLKTLVKNASVEFWFTQTNQKSSGSMYGDRSFGGSGDGRGGGGGQVYYQLFMEITGDENEEFLFIEKLNPWESFPNGWKYIWDKKFDEDKTIGTFDLKKAKNAFDEFQKSK